jgi:hypothetical protein
MLYMSQGFLLFNGARYQMIKSWEPQSGLTPFQVRKQVGIHNCQSCLKVLPWDIQYTWEECINALLQVSPQEEHPLELDLVMEEAMHSALNIQSTFLDMLHSITARHHPRTAMDLSRAEIMTSSSPDRTVSRIMISLSLSGCRHEPMTISSMIKPKHANAKADLIPTFMDSMRIIPCPEMTCGHWPYSHVQNMLHLPTRCCVKRTFLPCDVIATCNNAAIDVPCKWWYERSPSWSTSRSFSWGSPMW